MNKQSIINTSIFLLLILTMNISAYIGVKPSTYADTIAYQNLPSYSSTIRSSGAYPASVDLRDRYPYPKIKNQGNSETCHTQAVVSAMEYATKKFLMSRDASFYSGFQVSLSVQQAIGCMGWDNSANSTANALKTLKEKKIEIVAYAKNPWPFFNNSATYSCKPSNGEYVQLLNFYTCAETIGKINDDLVKRAINDGYPVIVNICYTDSWANHEFISKNAYSNNFTEVNHIVLIIGYDDINKRWLIQNSHGKSNHGNDGVFSLEYGCAYSSPFVITSLNISPKYITYVNDYITKYGIKPHNNFILSNKKSFVGESGHSSKARYFYIYWDYDNKPDTYETVAPDDYQGKVQEHIYPNEGRYRVRVLYSKWKSFMHIGSETRWVQDFYWTVGTPFEDDKIVNIYKGADPLLVPKSSFTEIPELWASPTEISKGEFLKVMGYLPYDKYELDNKPVTNVTYYDAIMFCNAKSKAEGYDTCYSYTGAYKSGNNYTYINGLVVNLKKNGYRLPTMEEWGHLYLGGISPNAYSGYFFDNTSTSEVNKYCYYLDNANRKVKPVGSLASNNYGLYDMAGNVSEYVHVTNGIFDRAEIGGSVDDKLSRHYYNSAIAIGNETKSDYRGFRVVRNWINMTPIMLIVN